MSDSDDSVSLLPLSERLRLAAGNEADISNGDYRQEVSFFPELSCTQQYVQTHERQVNQCLHEEPVTDVSIVTNSYSLIRNEVVKTPQYENMNPVVLKRLLAAKGLKHGPKNYMIRKLLEVWAIEHPEAAQVTHATDPPELALSSQPPKASRKRAPKKNPPSSTSGVGVSEDGIKEAPDGDVRAARSLKQKESMAEMIRQQPEWYERVLMMESIDVDEILDECAKNMYKCSRKGLITFLEEQGISYTQRQKHGVHFSTCSQISQRGRY